MSQTFVLTLNEARVIELLREIKANRGHGSLKIDIRDGIESLFRPEYNETPPMRT